VRPALAALENVYWRHAAQLYAIGSVSAASVEWLYNPEGRTAWTIVPGLAGVIAMISMLMLGALTLVRERERGSWETLLATPVDAVDALIGKLWPYIFIGTVQAAVVICIARLLFNLPVTGNLWALLVAMPLYSAAHLILGFAFSALAESQLQAIQGAVFFYLPSMLLSGFMFPFLGMPAWARGIGETLPLTHFVRATRGVLLKGEGGSLVAREMAPVAMFTLVAAALALAAYRRRID
jgi:ABC-2 type transport system permease protein